MTQKQTPSLPGVVYWPSLWLPLSDSPQHWQIVAFSTRVRNQDMVIQTLNQTWSLRRVSLLGYEGKTCFRCTLYTVYKHKVKLTVCGSTPYRSNILLHPFHNDPGVYQLVLPKHVSLPGFEVRPRSKSLFILATFLRMLWCHSIRKKELVCDQNIFHFSVM
jgi:hypothetical protein